jgi:hypothetical protein
MTNPQSDQIKQSQRQSWDSGFRMAKLVEDI